MVGLVVNMLYFLNEEKLNFVGVNLRNKADFPGRILTFFKQFVPL